MCIKMKKNKIVDRDNVRFNSPTVGGDLYLNIGVDENGVEDVLKKVLIEFGMGKENININTDYMNEYKELKDFLYKWAIGDIFNFKEDNNIFTSFAKSMLEWLIGINKFPYEKVDIFLKEIYLKYKINNSWINDRWKALYEYYEGNIEESVKIYIELYKKCDIDNTIPEWIKLDIYIDGRNLLLENDKFNNRFNLKENIFQEKLNNYNTIVYYPIIDRLTKGIYEKLNKNLFNIRTKSRNTIMYSNDIVTIFDDIQQILYVILMFGSKTHLNVLKSLISEILTLYAQEYKVEILYDRAIKMLLLSNKLEECNKLFNITKYENNKIYSIKYINELILTTDNIDILNKNKIQVFLFKIYGRYFSDEQFKEFEMKNLNIIGNLTKKININLIVNSYEAISYNSFRIKNKIKLLNNINIRIKRKEFRFLDNIIKILISLEIDSLSDKEKKIYINIVDNCLKLEREQLSNFGSVLIKLDKIKKYKEELIKFNKVLDVFSNIDNKKDIFNSIDYCIENIKSKYDERENKGGMTYGSYNFIDVLKYIINNNYNKEISEHIICNYIPLVLKILPSTNQISKMKINNLILIMKIINKNKEIGYRIKYDDVINLIKLHRDDIIIAESDIFFDRDKTTINIEIYVLMLEHILGLKDIKYVMKQYVEYTILSLNYIEDMLVCFEIYYEFIKDDIDDDIFEKIYYILFICINNESFDTKGSSIEYLHIFENTKYEENTIEWLYKKSINTTYEEGIQILNCINKIKNKVKYINILDNIINSNNYYIKKMAEDLKNKNINENCN